MREMPCLPFLQAPFGLGGNLSVFASISRAHLDCAPSKSLEIGPIRFTNGQTPLGICLHNTIRTHVLNILSALKGRFHNKALCCTGEERLGWRKDGLSFAAGKTIALST